MERQYYSFGRFRIDTQSRILLADEQRVGIPPKTADVLLALLEHSGYLVSKDDLLKLIWPDTFVEENNLAKHIFLLRKTLGEDEHGKAYIETIPRRGYRFVGTVDRRGDCGTPIIEYEEHARERIVVEETGKSSRSLMRWIGGVAILLVLGISAALLSRGRTHPVGQWRSVMVLPFATSGDADVMLGSAFTQELAARLRTIRSLRVVSPLATLDLRDAGNRLSVDTILGGRLEIKAGRLHAAAQLQSAQDGTVLWAEDATDLDAGDLQAAMVQMAASIASRLSGRLPSGERASLERRGSTNAQAYDAFLRGRAEMLKKLPDEQRASARAAAYFETAVRLDPGFANAWAGLAHAQQSIYSGGGADRSGLAAALGNAHRALSIDPSNTLARHALIKIHRMNGEYESMLREAKSLLEINPADPDSQAGAAFAYRYTGMLDRAINLYERYVVVYPDDEDAWYHLVHACVFAGDYDRGKRHAQPHVAAQRLLFPTFLLYLNSGDLPNAVALARQSIASGGGGAAPIYFAALVLSAGGFQTEARSAWSEAVKGFQARLTRVDNERTRLFLAMIYARLGQAEAARKQVHLACDMRPGDPWIGFFASETYAILNDRAAAIDALRKSVASGFLGLEYLDYYQRPLNGWYAYREDPEFREIYAGLSAKIADLRKRY